MEHGTQHRPTKRGAAASKKVSNHLTFRAPGPIREIIRNEMRSGKDRTQAIMDLIAAGARGKYPKLVERFEILQAEATC